MATYVVYHIKTGKIIHTHIESSNTPINKEGVFAMADKKYNRSLLEVAEVDSSAIDDTKKYIIDIKNKKLKTVKSKEGTEMASGGSENFDSPIKINTSKFKYSLIKK